MKSLILAVAMMAAIVGCTTYQKWQGPPTVLDGTNQVPWVGPTNWYGGVK